MAQQLDLHYNDFAGVDTRSNELLKNPRAARKGSKNFEYNYQDELVCRRGFKQKTVAVEAEFGFVEYVYTDINTGERKVQILGVDSSGILRRRYKNFLKLSITAASTVYYYSFELDSGDYYLRFYDNTVTLIDEYNVTNTDTLDDVATAVNALAIGGLSASVVDEDGATISSSLLGKLMDIVYREELDKNATDIELNEVWGWETIQTPDGLAAFRNVVNFKDDPNFEGISYVNINNAVYITDGGFPYKYDGYSLYRAGMPSSFYRVGNGISLAAVTVAGGALNLGSHHYKFQYGFVDPNGIEILGGIFEYEFQTTAGAENAIEITLPPIKRDPHFPVYACKVNGATNLNSGLLTFTVDAGHNIEAGMLLRIPISNASLALPGYSIMMCKVASVTATSITLDAVPQDDEPYPFGGAVTTLIDNQWINGGYAQSFYENKTEINGSSEEILNPEIFFGAFVRVYRTLTNQTDQYYKLIDLPLQYDDGSVSPAEKYTFVDVYSDTVTAGLSRIPLDESTEDNTLPKASRYLGKFQDVLVQGGRPYDPEYYAGLYYPTNYDGSIVNPWGDENPLYRSIIYYTEAYNADYLSIYWADSLNFESFPLSGLNELMFDNGKIDQITGFAQNKDVLFVFKNTTTAYVSGELETGNLQVEYLETDIGCAANATIKTVDGYLMFFDQNNGFHRIVAGRLPEPVGYPVLDYVKDNEQKPRDQWLNFKRARATAYELEDKYYCYFPAGRKESDETSSYPAPTSYSLTFVFDYAYTPNGSRNGWYIHQGYDANGDILASQDQLLICSSSLPGVGGCFKQNKTGTFNDYVDETSSIDFVYKSAFIHFGLPSIDKHYVRLAVNSIEGDFTITVKQYANFIDTPYSSYNLTFPAYSSTKKACKETAKMNIPKLSAMSVEFNWSVAQEYIRINGWDLEYSSDFDSGELKQ